MFKRVKVEKISYQSFRKKKNSTSSK